MSYIIPVSELTLSDIKDFKKGAIAAGIARAMSLGIARDEKELIVRHMLPFTDFGNGALGWTIEQYRNPAIAAAGWGSVFDAGAVPAFAPQLANTKVAVFLKYSNYSVNPTMLGVRFRLGANGATTLGQFHFQLEIGAKLEPDMYFSEPVVYSPQDIVYIEGYYNGPIGALGENFAFAGYIVERAGSNIS